MRVVIALLKHETNTFSPVPTPLSRFGNGGPVFGAAAYEAYRATATPMGAFIDRCHRAGAEIVTPVAAEAWPSGPVEDAAYAALTDPIVEAVAAGCDAVLLDLHGAMVTQSLEDGEGALLARLRKVAPDVPIGVALDLHANLTEAMAANSTAIAGFKTYPHTDMYETGQRVGRIIIDMVEGRCAPRMAWGNRPMLPHIMRQGTDESPMRDLVGAACRLEGQGLLAASVFGGFPHADMRDAGLSVVTVADGDAQLASASCRSLLDEAWSRRAEFVYRPEPAAEAVARARRLADGPILLLDHCDNCGSGGTQDVMQVLGEMIRQELSDAVAFAIHDPGAVARMVEAGVGARVTIDLGGKLAMPKIGLEPKPLRVEGTVRVITDGEYTIRGPMYTGVRVGMGRTVVLDTGRIEIVVIERHHEPWDVGCLLSLGIDPSARRYVMLKSRVHWRAGFWPVVRHVVECAGDGVTTSDYGRLDFHRLRRPIYPIDPHAEP
ncbi:MAG TPA: M81 family metallopeptidase [Arenibaculum sp.]|nr:M81 family metallopeptidase [Arenibaculum sp.]